MIYFHRMMSFYLSFFSFLKAYISRLSGRRIDFCFLLIIVVISYILTYLFNIYLFPEGASFFVSLASYIASGLLLGIVFLVSLKSSFIGYILLPMIVLVALFVYYVHSIFGIFISFEVIASVLETDMQEASSYMTFPLVLLFVGMLIGVIAFFYVGKRYIAKRVEWMDIAGLAVVYAGLSGLAVVGHVLSVAYYEDKEHCEFAYAWPLIDIRLNYKRVKEYMKKGGEQYYKIMHLPSMLNHESQCRLSEEDELTLLVHLGESVRADHLSMNGYCRETMPLLRKRMSHIVSFPRHQSYGLCTRVSIVGMLTDAEVKEREPKHKAFVDLLNRWGYATAAVIGKPHTIHDFPLKILLSDCQYFKYLQEELCGKEHLFSSTVDCFEKMDAALCEAKRKFIFVYDQGAHPFFQSLEQNKQFLPDEYDIHQPLADIDRLKNSYDNNLLEIDWEIDAIIKKLEDRVSIYLYVADHGVALGEQGQFGQSGLSEPVMNPALFIWMSHRFMAKYPEIAAALRLNAQKPVSHDYLIYTILSLAQIRSSLHKDKLDLTNPQAEPFAPVENLQILMGGQKNHF